VLLIDADLGLANVEILYGLTPKHHLGHVLDGNVPIQEALAHGPDGVRVLSAGSGVVELSQLDETRKMSLMSSLESLQDNLDLVLIDAGAGIGDSVRFFAKIAQEALLVITPEPTSLTDAYATVKVLSKDSGVPLFNVVVNQAPTESQAKEICSKLGDVVGRFLDTRLRYLGWIPRDHNLHRAVMLQRPLVSVFPHSPASRAVALLTEALFNTPVRTGSDGGLRFIWNRPPAAPDLQGS
jgi:flagellar biosynthesis protein FlhG